MYAAAANAAADDDDVIRLRCVYSMYVCTYVCLVGRVCCVLLCIFWTIIKTVIHREGSLCMYVCMDMNLLRIHVGSHTYHKLYT